MFHGFCGYGFQAYVSCSIMCLICQIPLTPNLTPKSQELSNNLFDKLRAASWVQGQLLEEALCHSQGLKKSFPIIPGQAGAHAALHMLHRLAVPLQSGRLPNCQWIRMLWEHIRSDPRGNVKSDGDRVRRRRWRVLSRKQGGRLSLFVFFDHFFTLEFVGKVFPLGLNKKSPRVFSCVKAKFLDFSCPELTFWQH